MFLPRWVSVEPGCNLRPLLRPLHLLPAAAPIRLRGNGPAGRFGRALRALHLFRWRRSVLLLPCCLPCCLLHLPSCLRLLFLRRCLLCLRRCLLLHRRCQALHVALQLR